MAYQTQNFDSMQLNEDSPLSASHLKHIEDGIVELETQITQLSEDINTALDNAIAEQEAIIAGGDA